MRVGRFFSWRQNGRSASASWVRAFWVYSAWLAVTLFGVLVFALLLPDLWHTLTEVCLAERCKAGQPTAVGLAALSHLGLSPHVYSVLMLSAHVMVPALIIAVMGFVLLRKPQDRVVVYLAFAGVTCSLIGPLTEAAGYHPWLVLPLHGFWVVAGAGFALGLFSFPDGRFVPSWSRHLAYVLAAASALVFVPGISGLGGTGEALAMGAFALTFPLALGCLLYRYTRNSDMKEKQQIKWVIFSVSVMVATLLVNLALTGLVPRAWLAAGSPGDLFTILLGSGSIVFFWLCIAVSVYRYGLFDIDLIIRRTLVYGGLSAAVTLLYMLLVTGTDYLLKTPGGSASWLLAALPVAFIARPLHGVLRRGVGRFFSTVQDAALEPHLTQKERQRTRATVWRWVQVFWRIDLGMVVRRTLVYGGLTLGVIAIYLSFIAAAGVLALGSNNLLVSLLATGAVALAFQPLRERLQRGVNRLLYGYRDEPYTVITELGRSLAATFEPTAVLPTTVVTVVRTLKVPFVEIALKQEGDFQSVASFGERGAAVETFPLVYAGETLGELRVSPRVSEDRLCHADTLLLADLSRQVGVAAHALLLQADLERSRLRIVTAREEARRQLGNDLHDTVGHEFAALTRRAETASNLLTHRPEEAQRLLEEIAGEGRAAAEHVRRLAHQLHPPELEVLGLLGVIGEWAEAEGGTLQVHLEVPASLPKLPAAVEVAAYCIVREALHNVHKHAHARHCTVRLALVYGAPLATSVLTALDTPVLEIDVTDDGCGVRSLDTVGMGLTSMRERAAEVGGACRVEPLPGRGTRVTVRLPCPEAS